MLGGSSYGQSPLAELYQTDDHPNQTATNSLVSVLETLEQQYQTRFSYDQELLKDKRVSDDALEENDSLEGVLARILKPLRLTYEQFDSTTVLIYPEAKRKALRRVNKQSLNDVGLSEQDKRSTLRRRPPTSSVRADLDKVITGQVTDLSTDETLPGVNVLVKGTTVGTVTDIDGNYRLTAPDDAETLVFSSVGYTSEEVAIGNQTVVNLALAPDIQSLSEVVVVGYGTQKKSDITGAISSVKAEDVNRAVTTSVEELLQGQAAGVTVSQSSNAPGGGISVRVRGTGSINGSSEPLYVVDGIPIANDDQERLSNRGTNFAGSNPSVSPLSQINPQDIASIEVLKDASAAAIYGARGANGVVLITTKKGKSGGGTLELSTSYGVQEATRLPELLNAAQFVALNDEARINAGEDAVFNGQVPPYNTNWVDEMYRVATVQNHNLSARGGNDKTTYALSLGYFDQEGVLLGTDLQRYSARLNLEQQATDWFRVGINATLSRTNQNNTGNNFIGSTYEMLPIGPVRINDEWFENTDMIEEEYDYDLQNANIDAQDNPVFFADRVENYAITDRVLGSVFAEVAFSERLRFRSTVGADIINGRTNLFIPNTATSTNRAANEFSNTSHLSVQNQLNYQQNFGQHNITATLVQSNENFRFERLRTLAEEVSDVTGKFNYDGDTRIANDKYPSAFQWRLASFLGRINYEFGNRYLITASARYDGSSRFGPDNRWGFFPSASVGWVISNEGFFGESSAVSFLKLRAGWGVTGNQNTNNNNFAYLSRIQGTRAVLNDELFPGIEPANISNLDLGWESSRQINVGVDAGLFSDRITLSANVYDKLTSELLLDTPIPQSSGQSNILINIGEVQNRGWEVELAGYVVDATFKWRTAINYSRNNNEVVALDGVADEIIDTDDNVNGTSILRPGLSLGSIYGYQTNGLWQVGEDVVTGGMEGAVPGDRRFVNQDTAQTVNELDRVVLGASLPVSSFGFNNTFSYKGLSLNVFIQGLGGMMKYNQLLAAVENTSGQENASVRVLDRWTPQNTNTQVQRATQGNRVGAPPGSSVNDYYVEDASFVRLKNVTLAYALPTAAVSRLGLQGIRVSVSAQNLFTLTDFSIGDPEAGSLEDAYPLVRSATVGLNVTF